MIRLVPGSHAYRMIQLLLLAGEFPFRSLGILGDTRTMKAVVMRMTEVHDVREETGIHHYHGRLVSVSGKSTMKTVRLQKYAFPFLRSIFPELMDYYERASYAHHFRGDEDVINRHHRIAEVIAMCVVSGIDPDPNQNPPLQNNGHIRLSFCKPAFYNSRYLKSLEKDEMNKIKYSRIAGAIYFGTGCYAVYNTRSSVMKWYGEGEYKMLLDLNDICRQNTWFSDVESAILFGHSYEIALKTIRFHSRSLRTETVLSGKYNSLHFIPLDDVGQKLLRMLTIPNWKQRLYELIFEPESIVENGIFAYDALEDNEYILCFMDSDIAKLSSFIQSVRTTDYKWSVLCFREQVPFLRSFLGEDVVIRSHKLDDVLEELETEGRNS